MRTKRLARRRSMATALLLFGASTCLTTSLATAQATRHKSIQLSDVTANSGVTFRHTHGGHGQRYIVETVAAGLAVFDYDGDGWLDVYFLNGAPRRENRSDAGPRNALYRNNGDWTFTDVTEFTGTGDRGFGLGVAVGDFDSDGDPDIYLNNFGPNVMLGNNGDGTFSEVTARTGCDAGEKVGAGTCFCDIDRDGDLDLYVANYVDFTYENHVRKTIDGYEWYASPRDYQGTSDILYENNGDGTFSDISQRSGIGNAKGNGMGVISADYDDDGDCDVFVCNDISNNFLFQNDGSGVYQEVALLAGVAYDLHGHANGSMGVDCADINNDGLLDFFMTDYQGERPVWYRNIGGGFFEDASLVSGIGRTAIPHVTWGIGAIDFDNDGDRDIFIACGHTDDNIDRRDTGTSYRVANILMENLGDESFADVSASVGDGLVCRESSRGAAFDDLDNDGDVDAVILNAQSLPTIIRNELATRSNWVELQLVGIQSNRDAVGARVTISSGSRQQIAEVHGGRGYQGHHGARLHFGLGPAGQIDRLQVRWPNSTVEVFQNVQANSIFKLIEGQGQATRLR